MGKYHDQKLIQKVAKSIKELSESQLEWAEKSQSPEDYEQAVNDWRETYADKIDNAPEIVFRTALLSRIYKLDTAGNTQILMPSNCFFQMFTIASSFSIGILDSLYY